MTGVVAFAGGFQREWQLLMGLSFRGSMCNAGMAKLFAFFCKLQNLFDLWSSNTYYCANHFHSFLVIRGILVPGHSGC
jgi:hypothetical protein